MRRRYRILGIGLAVLAVVVLVDTFASGAWSERNRVHKDLATLRADNGDAEHRASILRSDIDGMNTNSEFQERAVRHELGFIRQGDIVLDVGDDQP